MTAQNRSLPVTHLAVAGLVVALLGYSIHLKRELVRVSEQLHAASQARIEPPPSHREAVAADAAKKTDEIPADATAEPAVKSQEPSGRDAPEALFSEFSKYRDKRELRLIYHVYSDFLTRLHLSPSQTQSIADLLADRDLTTKEARDAANTAGLNKSQIEATVAESTKGIELKLQGLLGEENYAKLQEVPIVNMFRSSLEASVGVDLSLAGVSLSNEQTTRIAEIWAKLQNPSLNLTLPQMSQAGTNPATGLTPIHEAIVSEASSVLTPSQAVIFRAYFVEQDSSKPDRSSAIVKRD